MTARELAAAAAAPAVAHVCRWGPVLRWTPPSSYQVGPSADRPLADSVPYRECSCGETVWGDRVTSAYVLDNLALRVAGSSAQ